MLTLIKTKVIEMPQLSSNHTVLNSMSQSRMNMNMPSTPTQRFRDDSAVRFSDSNARANDLFGDGFSRSEDASRRFTIDNFALMRGSNAQSAANLPPPPSAAAVMGTPNLYNRFTAISENDIEQQELNTKSLQMEYAPEQEMRRISTLQIRNTQTKPHLQSSYPTEMLTQASEEVIRRGEVKENRLPSSASNGMLKNVANQKRRMDEASSGAKSPKKSNTVRTFSFN